MATLTVRNLAERTRRALKERAAHNYRSMEAEARAILEHAVSADQNFVAEWLVTTESLRDDDFTLPERSVAREVDLT